MYGLTVRWSLADAPDGRSRAPARLRRGRVLREVRRPDGLRFKSWRAREGEWFEGSYVFVSRPGARRIPGRLRAPRGRRRAGIDDHRHPADPHRALRDRRPSCAARPGSAPSRQLRARRSERAAGLGRRQLGDQQAVAERQQHAAQQVVVVATRLTSSRIATVSGSRCDGSATRSCHRALSNTMRPPGRTRRSACVEVLAVLDLVAVEEHQVVAGVGEPGHDVERRAGDEPEALRRDAGRGERLAGEPLVLGLEVHRREHAVGLHAAQQPQAGDARAGADLGDRLGADGRGQERQGRSGAGPDRDDADLVGSAAGSGEVIVLGLVALDVRQAGCGGDGRLLGRWLAPSLSSVYAPRAVGARRNIDGEQSAGSGRSLR